jgi:hypothetical protein
MFAALPGRWETGVETAQRSIDNLPGYNDSKMEPAAKALSAERRESADEFVATKILPIL